jgi:selenocysteine lyase/cysteine desulfurase
MEILCDPRIGNMVDYFKAYNCQVNSQQNAAAKHGASPVQARRKQIVYRFNGDPKDDEIVADRNGTMPFRKVGEILARNGKRWRVAVVRDDFNMASSKTAVPVHHVFLTDNF